ncbi:hypothetical protein BDQ12DRAFT_380563 [Crucibulum laeve]|uniref:Uncharacterized protein n=1 Tax=Crucibulum laeve TaxID=68775 RepID=A0A5C3LP13_9AGAR|nr:hypothetical protein BDQ12DRAFT_380563 [Crucibulum laeve]
MPFPVSVSFPAIVRQMPSPPSSSSLTATTPSKPSHGIKRPRPRGLWKARATGPRFPAVPNPSTPFGTTPAHGNIRPVRQEHRPHPPPTSSSSSFHHHRRHRESDTDDDSDRDQEADNYYNDDDERDSYSSSSSKRRRRSGSDTTPASSDEEDLNLYWESYARRKGSLSTAIEEDNNDEGGWTTRTKMMDISSTAGPGTITTDSATCDLEDWEDLKELFAKATEQYESAFLSCCFPYRKNQFIIIVDDDPSESLPLLRGVIHECHRFLLTYNDPSVIFIPPAPQPAPMRAKSLHHDSFYSSVWPGLPPKDADTEARKEKERKKKLAIQQQQQQQAKLVEKNSEPPTAFHTILGSALFLFGNLIAQDPSLAMEGEPASAAPYYLAALDVFETGETLPARVGLEDPAQNYNSSTSPSYVYKYSSVSPTYGFMENEKMVGSTKIREDWRMAIAWGRTLVALADEMVNRAKAADEHASKLGPGSVVIPLAGPSPFPIAPAPGVRVSPDTSFTLAASLASAPSPSSSPTAGFSSYTYQMPHSDPFTNPPTNFPPAPSPLHSLFAEPSWPVESPFAIIADRRPPVTRRMSLVSATPNDVLVLAVDQFSKGILHMPHPQSGREGGKREKRPVIDRAGSSSSSAGKASSSSGSGASVEQVVVGGRGERVSQSMQTDSLAAPAPSSANSVTTITPSAPHPPSSSHPTHHFEAPFSRSKELFTIATDVLLISEKLPVPSERAHWAEWADGVFGQMKVSSTAPDVSSSTGQPYSHSYTHHHSGGVSAPGGINFNSAWGEELVTRSRGRCMLIAGSARAEELEGALERGEMGVLESEEAEEARESLQAAVGYFERARGWVEERSSAASSASKAKSRGKEKEHMEVESSLPSHHDEDQQQQQEEQGKEDAQELRSLLAEALVTLANLTRDESKREELYARAQAEGGDDWQLELDSMSMGSVGEDGMDLSA